MSAWVKEPETVANVVMITEEYLEAKNYSCPLCREDSSLVEIDEFCPDADESMGTVHECSNCLEVVVVIASTYCGHELLQEMNDKGPVYLKFDSEDLDEIMMDEIRSNEGFTL